LKVKEVMRCEYYEARRSLREDTEDAVRGWAFWSILFCQMMRCWGWSVASNLSADRTESPARRIMKWPTGAFTNWLKNWVKKCDIARGSVIPCAKSFLSDKKARKYGLRLELTQFGRDLSIIDDYVLKLVEKVHLELCIRSRRQKIRSRSMGILDSIYVKNANVFWQVEPVVIV
jgi:hypothetical protein